MQQLQTREISSNDYDMLLKLDEHRNRCSNKGVNKCIFCEASSSNEELKRPDNELATLNCKKI